MKSLIIIRGLPGSGKSTLAKKYEDAKIFEADAYPGYYPKGEYEFSYDAMKKAHPWCMKQFTWAVINAKEHETLIVSNTSMRTEEWLPYVRVAQAFEFDEFHIVNIIAPQLKDLWGTIHGVSDEKVAIMQRQYEMADYVSNPFYGITSQETITLGQKKTQAEIWAEIEDNMNLW